MTSFWQVGQQHHDGQVEETDVCGGLPQRLQVRGEADNHRVGERERQGGSRQTGTEPPPTMGTRTDLAAE